MIPVLRTALLTIGFAIPAAAADVTVFAAASLGDALGDAAEVWETDTGNEVTLVLAGSATLARQIEAGAPADVYIAANMDWMDWLADRGRVLEEGRFDLASNALVLVASDPALTDEREISPDTDILAKLGEDGRLAIALPDAVPAGIYGKAALQTLGLWNDVSQRLAPMDNVRAALALVALGEAPLGVVYATDAVAEERVVVAGRFPDSSHPPIAYPAGVVTDSDAPDVSAALLKWLRSEVGQAAFAQHGFLPPRQPQ